MNILPIQKSLLKDITSGGNPIICICWCKNILAQQFVTSIAHIGCVHLVQFVMSQISLWWNIIHIIPSGVTALLITDLVYHWLMCVSDVSELETLSNRLYQVSFSCWDNFLIVCWTIDSSIKMQLLSSFIHHSNAMGLFQYFVWNQNKINTFQSATKLKIYFNFSWIQK